MRRGRDFVGLTVYHADRKEPVGEVQDVIVDAQGRVSALVISLRGLFRKERALLLSEFESITSDGARLRQLESLGSQSEQSVPGVRLYCDDHGLCGRSLIGEDGKEIGTIGDAVFDGDPPSLWGFEVSDGILKDFLDGRPVVEAMGATFEGHDVVLKSQNGGHMNLVFDGHPMS